MFEQNIYLPRGTTNYKIYVDNWEENKYNYICKRRKHMVAKIWKKVLFVILIIACLFNIVNKLVHKASLEQELQSSAEYIQQQQAEGELNN